MGALFRAAAAAPLSWLLLLLGAAATAPRFQGAEFHEMDAGLGATTGPIMALGDLNDDKFTDLVLLDAENHCLRLQLWSHDAFAFEPAKVMVCVDKAREIWNVLLTDFDYDGSLDVVVTTVAVNWASNGTTEMCVVFGKDLVDNLKADPVDDAASLPRHQCVPILPGGDVQGQWTVLSLSGDLRSELFGATTNGNAAIAVDAQTKQFVRRDDALDGACELADVHWTAFVDMNGDCAADVVLTCQPKSYREGWLTSLEIWLAEPAVDVMTFRKTRTVQLPYLVGPVTFVDVNADGTMDMVYFECDDQSRTSTCQFSSTMHIRLNEQLPDCSTLAAGSTVACHASVGLCIGDDAFLLEQEWEVDASALDSTAPSAKFLLRTAWPGTRQQSWLPSRWADYNVDGYPDALVTVMLTNGVKRVWLLRNLLLSSCAADGCATRTLALDLDATSAIASVQNATSGAFYDLDESGRIDVLVMVPGGGTRVFFNNIFEDAFFLKTLGLNGVCSSGCSSSLQPVGVNEPGVTIRFMVTKTDGVKRVVQGSQLTQFCFGALSTPFVLYGLGRTNAYIDEFAVGMPMKATAYYHVWYGLIPNSQLFISPSFDESGWLMELYVSPAAYSGWVALALAVTAVVLSLVVLLLHWLELREDARERRGALMHINFDAF